MEAINIQNLISFDFYGKKYAITQEGDIYSLNSNRWGQKMSQRIDRAGYMTVKLIKNGKGSTQYVHRILAMNFFPNPENKKMVNHKNGNKLDNGLENLEWVSGRENMIHAINMHLIFPFCKKEIVDHCTGEKFSSLKEAAKSRGIPYGELKAIVRNSNINTNCLQIAA